MELSKSGMSRKEGRFGDQVYWGRANDRVGKLPEGWEFGGLGEGGTWMVGAR